MTHVHVAPDPHAPSVPALRRTLGLWQVAFSGMGVILGAGVYALIGPTAGLAGGAIWLAFVVAGTAAGLTAYAYARLGVMQPKNSPEFQYTALAFGPRAGSVAGWLMLAADLLAAATVALGFGGYLSHLIGTPLLLNALALLAGILVILLVGIGETVRVGIVLTVIDILGLLFIVAIGIPYWGSANYLEMPHGMAGVWGAASLVFFAYLGFDELGNFVEEMRAPKRDLPRALLLAMVVSTGIYLLVGLSAVGAVGWQALSASQAPLALVAGRALGGSADMAMSFIALTATAKTSMLLLASAARSVYGMAAAGVLPRQLSFVGGRGIPVVATVFVLGIATNLLFLGDLEHMASLTNAAILTSFGMVNFSLLWLAARGHSSASRGERATDFLLSGLAVSLCGWLFLYTGWVSMAVAGALAVVGFLAAMWGKQLAE